MFKATFGTYNLSSMIENSFLSLMSTFKQSTDIEEMETICFISLNDGLNLIANEVDAYSKVIQAIAHYIPATVRLHSLPVRYHYLAFYLPFYVPSLFVAAK